MGTHVSLLLVISSEKNWLSDTRVDRFNETPYAYLDCLKLGYPDRFTKAPSVGLNIVSAIQSAEEGFYSLGIEEDDRSYNGKVAILMPDGEVLAAETHEQFIEIEVLARPFCENGGRGNWAVLRAIIDWLHVIAPEGKVLMGEDNVPYREMTETALQTIDDTWCQPQFGGFRPSPVKKNLDYQNLRSRMLAWFRRSG